VNRRAAATLILLTWLGALGWLWRRETRTPRSTALDDAVRTVEPGALYYRVSMGGVPVGFASNTVDTVPQGLLIEDRLSLEIPALGALQRIEAHTTARLTNTLRLRSFVAELAGDAGRFTANGEVWGDTLMRIELQSAGNQQQIRVPLDEPVVLPVYMPLRLVLGSEPEVGKQYAIRTFDPLLLQHSDVSVNIVGDSILFIPDSAAFDSTAMQWVPARWDTVPAWQVEQKINGVSVNGWIDHLGRVVSASSPLGLSMERSAFELAFTNFRDRDRSRAIDEFAAADIIQQTAIASNIDLSTDRPRLQVVLSGIEQDGFDLDGGRQTLAGDTLIVTRERLAELRAGYRLPARSPELWHYVRPEPLIQSEDPRIQAQARRIVDRTRDPLRAAERLNAWVYEEIEKEITVSVPSAAEVLETGRGDCNEHAILYVALARAVGLPARTAAGLVYARGRFYYHAWPEVYLGEWVAVDPTFGQFPADASHLRFTIGGLARQAELIRLIGRLSLDVVDEAP
jgi:transglutaminase-like putative cysteine protease